MIETSMQREKGADSRVVPSTALVARYRKPIGGRERATRAGDDWLNWIDSARDKARDKAFRSPNNPYLLTGPTHHSTP